MVKYLWVVVLVAAGGLVFFLTLGNKQEADQGVVLQEVFKQTPSGQSLPSMTKGAAPVQADPVSAPAIVTTPVNGHETGFLIQVYSFQDKARADKALAGLQQAGYKAFLEVSDLGEKGTWYRVRVGGLDNEAQAQGVLEEIRKNYQSGFIVKPKK
ncbi:MAG: SPOR domain-containing protein [Candidatus Omnitrophica bacterium]|nr:SPOR domain-containing protein [Candidatus Omnitrophota bacterium]